MLGIDINAACHYFNIENNMQPIKQKIRKSIASLTRLIKEKVTKLIEEKFIQEV